MKYRITTLLFAFIFLIASTMSAQVEDDPDGALEEEEKKYSNVSYNKKKGLMYGLNIGVLLANKDAGLFYNGTAPNDITVYLNNSNVVTEIREFIGGYNFTLVELPEEMRYKAGVSFGVNVKYQFDWHTAIVADINYSQLNTNGQIVLETDQVDPNTANPFLEFFDIWGKEDRMVTSLGFQYTVTEPSAAGTFVEFGPLLTTVKVRENGFSVGNRTYNILRPQAITGNQFLNNRQPSVNDFGLYGALGFNFEFDKFTLDMILRTSLEKIQFEPEVETKHKFHFFPNFRFTYRLLK